MPNNKDMDYSGNKSNYSSYTRKLGVNERLILSYAITSKRFTISDIVVHFRNMGKKLSNKRIWDSVQRLIKKGFVRKIDRGIYELAKDIDYSVLDSRARKENLYQGESLYQGDTHGDGEDNIFYDWRKVLKYDVGVVRVHGNGRNVFEYFMRVYFAFRLLRCVVRRLEDTLIRLGFSRSYIRRAKSRVNSVVSNVCDMDGVVGCHGRYGSRKRFSGLKPLSLCVDGSYYEYGVDINASGSIRDIVGAVGKPFIKIYLSLG